MFLLGWWEMKHYLGLPIKVYTLNTEIEEYLSPCQQFSVTPISIDTNFQKHRRYSTNNIAKKLFSLFADTIIFLTENVLSEFPVSLYFWIVPVVGEAFRNSKNRYFWKVSAIVGHNNMQVSFRMHLEIYLLLIKTSSFTPYKKPLWPRQRYGALSNPQSSNCQSVVHPGSRNNATMCTKNTCPSFLQTWFTFSSSTSPHAQGDPISLLDPPTVLTQSPSPHVVW